MSTQSEQLPQFPFDRPPLAPPHEYSHMREQGTFAKVRLWDGSHAWLVTRYKDVRAVLADNRFSIEPTRKGFPCVSEARGSLLQGEVPTFIRMDPPQHTVLRRMLAKEFTHARMQAMRPQIQQVVDQLLTDMLAMRAPVDFVEAFALPLPSIIISQMLGVPYEDHAFFQDRSRKKVALDVGPQIPLEASKELRDYLDRLVTAKEKNPGDDLISRLVIEQIRPGHLSHDEAVRMADLLLLGGHETTANMVALGTLSLLQDPKQFRLLQTDPSISVRATEEMLRYHTIVQFAGARVAKEDVEIGGRTIRAGEGVLALISSANRDQETIADPDAFDICRPLSPHVAFGFGVHQCLGQPLARLEMDVVFSTLPVRVPTLRLAIPPEQLAFKKNVLVYGVESMPVVW